MIRILFYLLMLCLALAVAPFVIIPIIIIKLVRAAKKEEMTKAIRDVGDFSRDKMLVQYNGAKGLAVSIRTRSIALFDSPTEYTVLKVRNITSCVVNVQEEKVSKRSLWQTGLRYLGGNLLGGPAFGATLGITTSTRYYDKITGAELFITTNNPHCPAFSVMIERNAGTAAGRRAYEQARAIKALIKTL